MAGQRPHVRRASSDELTPTEIAVIRDLLVRAFATDEDEAFGEDDWDHALGGTHFVLDLDGVIVGHASVVERVLEVDGRMLRTGYVEAVGVAPDRQGAGVRLTAHARRDRLDQGAVRARRARHRPASLLRTARLADLGRTDIGPHD